MKKLINMTDFVLWQHAESSNQNEFEDNCYNYAKFLKKPLELGMFVPIDEDGNVLEFPKVCICTDSCSFCKKYQKAKEKVLFEGFEFFESQVKATNTMLGDYGLFPYAVHLGFITHTKGQGYHAYYQLKTIEDLVKIKKGILLTKSAIKQLGL